MVFRKPYAFLIKNFKKIHIVLLVLCAFIFFKSMQLNSFLNDFINYLSYDPIVEPITKYTSFLFYIFIFILKTSQLSVVLCSSGRPDKNETKVNVLTSYHLPLA